MTRFSTSDICDQLKDNARVPKFEYRNFGGKPSFEGVVTTVRIDTDNQKVISTLQENGKGRVLVVSANDKSYSAIVGDRLAKIASDNTWEGVIVDGAVRDIRELNQFPLGVAAKSVFPVRGKQNGGGEVGCDIELNGVTVSTGDYCYVDHDGIVFCKEKI